MDEEDMNNSAVNFTTDEASTNLTISVFDEIDILLFNVLGFSFLFGFPTNTYVIWLIITGAGSGVALDFFILNLSVCGLFYSLNSLIRFVTKWFLLSSLLPLSHFLTGLAITGRPLFQCLICVERYLAVVHPVTFLKFKPLRYRVICCTVAWIITLGSCIITMLNFLLFTFYTHMWFVFMQFLLFLSIQLFCLVAVLRALKQSGPGKRGREREEENRMKKRAFYLILVATMDTIITYVPLTICGLLSIVTEDFFQIFFLVSCFCFTLAGFVPLVLYLHRVGKLSCHSICKMFN